MVQQNNPQWAQDPLIIKYSWPRSGTPHSVELPWTSDQADAETSLSDNTQNSQETNMHAPSGMEPTIPASKRPRSVLEIFKMDGYFPGSLRNYKFLFLAFP